MSQQNALKKESERNDKVVGNFSVHCAAFGISFLCLIVSACTSSHGTSDSVESAKSDEFPLERTVNCSGTEPDVIMSVENWAITDSSVVCQNGGMGQSFYGLSLKDFQAVDSFGTRGQGPGEFLYPKVAKVAGQKKFGIVDNGKCRLYMPGSSGEGYDEFQLSANAMNFPVVVGDSAVIFVDYKPDKLSLSAYDFHADKLTALVEFTDEHGEAIQNDFMWDTNGDRIILCHNFKDCVSIGNLTPDLSVAGQQVYSGKGSSETTPFFYYDVELGGKYFYLLSEKNLDSGFDNGGSDIEIYDYDCTPIAVIHTDRPFGRMLLDEEGHRLLLTTTADDLIYQIALNPGEY